MNAFSDLLGPRPGLAAAATLYFSISALSASDGFSDIGSWRQHHFGIAENNGNAANVADPDADGIANILEYALFLDPLVKDKSGLPAFSVDSSGFSLSYLRARADIDYVVEGSANLVEWSTDAVDQGAAGLGEVTARAPFGYMMRLRVYQAVETVTGLRESGTDTLEFSVNSTGWADLHYRVNGGDPITVRMHQADGENRFTLGALSEGDSVEYAFTYFADTSVVQSDWQSHRFSGDFNAYTYVPLYSEDTELEPITQVETDEALYTYFSDRARDRHAREDQDWGSFKAYDHYLSFYWEHRTAEVEIIDKVAKGGNEIIFNVRAPWKYKDAQAELRAFYRGIGTVAEYWDNKSMTEVHYQPGQGAFFKHYPDDRSPVTPDTRYYTRVFNFNAKEGRPIQPGEGHLGGGRAHRRRPPPLPR